MFWFFLIIVIIVCIKKLLSYMSYIRSPYYNITKHSYSLVRHNVGMYGEFLTYKSLQHFESCGAKFLFNVYIPKKDGETTEIDILMVSPKGVFVFESKNYSGWIFGSEHQKQWCQVLPNGKNSSQKKYFYNPIMQNSAHIKHLKAYLGEHIPVYSVIVFSDRCTLKDVPLGYENVHLINRSSVGWVVSKIYNQSLGDFISVGAVQEIYNRLYPFTQVGEFAKFHHVENVHTDFHYNQKCSTGKGHTQESLRCPYCNGTLVLRVASRGPNIGKQFYGCSNYPKCRYIQNINQ